MKRIKIITAAISLCMAATLFAGCNNASDESAAVSRIDGGQTKITVNNSGSDNQPATTYKFSYKGCDIVLRELAQPIFDVLGTPVSFIPQSEYCGGEGMVAEYTYPGFSIQTFELADGEVVAAVVITDSLIDCGGVRVGDNIDVAKQVYGTPAEEDDFGQKYISGYVTLRFITDGAGTITEIQYYDNNR